MNQAVLDRICGAIHKKYGKESITFLGNKEPEALPRISTQCPQLDEAMGGGLPEGRIIEIYGPESSGKSTLCMHAIAEAQMRFPEIPVAFIDSEYGFDPIYAQAIGVNVHDLLVSQPDNGTQALSILVDLIEEGVKLIIVDSVAALLPQEEDDADLMQNQMGVQARMMSKGLRKINNAAGRSGTTIIFTNQTRDKIGKVYGSPETTPGGKALRFYASVRVKTGVFGSVKEKIKGVDEKVANIVKVTIVKNKTAVPFKTTTFTIRYGIGIDRLEDLITTCISCGMVVKKGGWFAYNGENIAQGKANLRKYFEADASFCEKMRELTKGKAIVASIPDDDEDKEGVAIDTEEAEEAGVEATDV